MKFSDALVEAISARSHLMGWIPTACEVTVGVNAPQALSVYLQEPSVVDGKQERLYIEFDEGYPSNFMNVGLGVVPTFAQQIAPDLPFLVVAEECPV